MICGGTSLYEKKIKVLRQFNNSSRIIIAGGSGTHYGIDAVKMEKMLDRPVINMGNHGGIGLNAIVGTIEGEVKDGDIVILISEHGILSDDGIGWLSAAFGVAIGMPGIGGIGCKQTIQEIFKGCTLNLTSFGKSIMRIFFEEKGRASNLIDERGGAVVFTPGKAVPGTVSAKMSANAKLRLMSLKSSISKKGGRLLFSLPWVLIGNNDQKSRIYVMNIVQQLEDISPVLYDTKTVNLYHDISLFSDSFLHNTAESRKRRTEELVSQLQQVLKQ